MRLSYIAWGLAGAALLTLPLLPQSLMADGLHAPAKQTAGKVLEAGGDAVGGLFATAAQAQETEKSPIDFSKLVKVDDQQLNVTFDDSVSQEVMRTHRITKIGLGGNVTQVTVVRTATGSYSTDGIASPHIQYHGVDVEPVSGGSGGAGSGLGLIWRTGAGWVPLPVDPMDSVITYGPMMNGGSYVTTPNGSCFESEGYVACS